MAQRSVNTPELNKNLLILHFTVFIWGFTSILGALITVSAVQLVWYRVLIAMISLFFYFKFNKTAFKVSRKTFLKLFFTRRPLDTFLRFYQAFYRSGNAGLPVIHDVIYRHFRAIYQQKTHL
jgi:hypothetical protein